VHVCLAYDGAGTLTIRASAGGQEVASTTLSVTPDQAFTQMIAGDGTSVAPMEWWAGMVVLAVALMGATGCTRNAEALQSFELLNAERSARGLPHVTLDGQLIDKAHGWAEVMSRTGVRHSVLTEGAGDTWMVLAENVGARRT
jgi:uncharacterized protein YkwD